MYYFFLGNTPALSTLELKSLTPLPLTPVLPTILSTPTLPSPSFLTSRLGGVRKLALESMRGGSSDVLALLEKTLASLPNKNVAVTDYANLGLTKSDLHQLKGRVPRPLRFVSMDTHEHELILLSHQHVAELNLLPLGDGAVAVAVTTWIFDAEDWIKRDRSKPYRDIKRGMLPPKLARILVNLATRGQAPSLYDPFCGTGTVLSEAALAGVSQLYGSDTNPTAVTGTRANLDWTRAEYGLPTLAYSLEVADATHPPFPSFASLATEPYMGPLLDERNPLPLNKIKDIAKGLDKLYRGALKAWHPRLTGEGRVVLTLPSFAVYGQVIPTISVDTLTALGYNLQASVAYGKPGATVIRNITILEKK